MSHSVHPTIIMNQDDIQNAITRMSYEIIEKKKNLDKLAIVGIKTRGEFLAQRFTRELERISGIKTDFGILDITLYRDDFDKLGNLTIGETDLLFDVQGKRILLVDDVLYTGRTIRAALDQIVDFGRPAEIELATLVEREGRELPICPDYVGQHITLEENEYVLVHLMEIDECDQVIIQAKDKAFFSSKNVSSFLG